MGILQNARLLSSNETCRCSERIAVFVGVAIQFAPPENPPFTQEFYSYYELETSNRLLLLLS